MPRSAAGSEEMGRQRPTSTRPNASPAQTEPKTLKLRYSSRFPYDNITDHERKLIGEELYKLVPDPEYMDYVFHPKEDLPISDTIDKAIEKAFQYKPIAL